MTTTVGIERLSAHLPMCALALDDLARARGVEAAGADGGIATLLEQRRRVSVEEYEALRRGEASGHLEPPAGFAGHFFYAGTERDRRRHLPTR